MRARLIACDNLRWCLAQTLLRLRGTIFEYEEMNRRNKVVFL